MIAMKFLIQNIIISVFDCLCTMHNVGINLHLHFPGLLAGPSGIRVGWGIETNGRFEAERPPTSVGPPSGGRAAFLSPMHPLYSTRPHGLVLGIFWYTCPDLDLVGQWLAGFESRLVPDLPLSFIPTSIGLRAFDLVSSPVWWKAATNTINLHLHPFKFTKKRHN